MSNPWMPLYVADYLADTVHLSTVEHGAYMLLIMTYWRNRKLPQDDVSLSRIVRMTAREWQAVKPTIQALFGDDWRHKRIDSELEKADRKSEARATAGSRGGNAKALKQKNTNVANATNLPEQKPADALASSSQPQSDVTNVTKTRAPSARSADAEILIEFEGEFWQAFPNKVGKPIAEKSFLKARKSHSLETIMAGLDRYKRDKPHDRPWLNPSTFLNQERFLDQPASNARAGPSTSIFAAVAMGDFGGDDGNGSRQTPGDGASARGGFDGVRGHAAAVSQPDRMASLGPLLDLRAEPAERR